MLTFFVRLTWESQGYGLTHDNSRSRPADVLVTRWEKGLPAALDITVTSPLNPAILDESCSTAGVAAVAAESRKHVANDPKCLELGWTCVPLAVESYGDWGVEAQETFSHLVSLLAASHSVSKSKATADIYGRLNQVCGQGYPGQGSKAKIDVMVLISNSLV